MELPSHLDLNPEFNHALEQLEITDKNIFVTGKAGTGKSTLLEYFRQNTGKRLVVLAPTGVAAINVKGETIHSFFGFKPDTTINKIRKISRGNPRFASATVYKETDMIIIDEISMVRADLLDLADKFLRLNGPDKKKPFGGIQMVFIGDLYQLPPVVTSKEKEIFKEKYETSYFFSSNAFEALKMEYIELEKIYRQKDESFIGILNAIRNNNIEDRHIQELNSRYDPLFEAREDYHITLTSTNKAAEEINDKRLSKLISDEFILSAITDGDVDAKSFPTQAELKLKVGAQVMMLNNDKKKKWVNGTLAKIAGISEDNIIIELENGDEEVVVAHTWELFHFSYDAVKERMTFEVVGTFTQFPMKLAWAVTIHKSQGLTFDKVVIDVGKGTFAHGQYYVALSRCRTLGGITLKVLAKRQHVLMDWKVREFVTKYQYKRSEEKMSLEDKISILEMAVKNKKQVEILYLKAKDEKSRRKILPYFVGDMEYKDKIFTGVKARCDLRKQDRVFNAARILEIIEL